MKENRVKVRGEKLGERVFLYFSKKVTVAEDVFFGDKAVCLSCLFQCNFLLDELSECWMLGLAFLHVWVTVCFSRR